MKRYSVLLGLWPLFLLLGSSPTVAETPAPPKSQLQIEINTETPAFQSRQLKAGAVSILVNYDPRKMGAESASTPNLRYQIAYEGVVKVKAEVNTYYFATLSLQDLDRDRRSEVIVETFSGGAHCCTNIQIYSWAGNKFKEVETGPLNGRGGSFEDLDGDGKIELVSNNNGFLYQFSSYAESFPATVIYAFQNGKLEDVTRQHPKTLRATLQRMYDAFLDLKRNGGAVNGVLAGYVAQKILLGEYQQGWNFMLANYDRKSDWGLTIFNAQGQEVGRYRNYPLALMTFLKDQGYLDAKGQPVK